MTEGTQVATTANNAEDDSRIQTPKSGMTAVAGCSVFLAFPLVIGLFGLYIAYLDGQREISIDQDFVMPFLLAAAVSAVIYMQTRGFASREVEPLVKWPKVKRVKKVVKRSRKKED